MVTRMTPTQLKNKLRQMESQRKQAINRYNQQVRKYNQETKQNINKYNNSVRQYNAQVRALQQKIKSETSRLNIRKNQSIKFRITYDSTISVNKSYLSLMLHEDQISQERNGWDFIELSTRENANSLEVSNNLETNDNESYTPSRSLKETYIDGILQEISGELSNRWQGALYSLSPDNPDSARHFCTSSREIFVQLLDMYAPDSKVINQFPMCERVHNSNSPTRKSKFQYLLSQYGITTLSAVDFVDNDINSILNLFKEFNDGTHGTSGRFSNKQLESIKIRVEDGIDYLTKLCRIS